PQRLDQETDPPARACGSEPTGRGTSCSYRARMRWWLLFGFCACGRVGFDERGVDGGGGGGGSDMPQCVLGPWSAPGRLAALDTIYNEIAPALSADGLTLVFESDRLGDRDLYIATRPSTSADFGSPILLDALDTPWNEHDPAFSMDGLSLYFTSDQNG